LFYEKLMKWMIISNQPFTEVESEELRDLLVYLKPCMSELVKADAIKERIMKYGMEKRDHLIEILKVSTRRTSTH